MLTLLCVQTKEIAGRIVPALATTTAVAAGLVSIELYKVVQALRIGVPVVPNSITISHFKTSFFDLSTPQFSHYKPNGVPIKKVSIVYFYLFYNILQILQLHV